LIDLPKPIDEFWNNQFKDIDEIVAFSDRFLQVTIGNSTTNSNINHKQLLSRTIKEQDIAIDLQRDDSTISYMETLSLVCEERFMSIYEAKSSQPTSDIMQILSADSHNSSIQLVNILNVILLHYRSVYELIWVIEITRPKTQ